MLTVESLKALGADTDAGIARCVGSEAFYLNIAGRVIADPGYEKLRELIEAKDLKGAFEQAHALKGLTGNASLDPLSRPIIEITEHLRAGEDIDYEPLLTEIEEQLALFRGIAETDE